MARILDSMPPLNRGGQPPKYPWDEWLNGEVWSIAQDEDFFVSSKNMVSILRNKAKGRGLNFTSSRVGPTITFQVSRASGNGDG